jgi:exocyst complex component 2
MAELDRSVLRHYNLSTSYPTEWPAEKDHSDASDDESPLPRPPNSSRPVPPKDKVPFSRSKSKRYSVLERNTRQRRIRGPELGVGGSGDRNAVQKDEPDPLGSPDSVVRILRQRGLPVDEDAQLRKRPSYEFDSAKINLIGI